MSLTDVSADARYNKAWFLRKFDRVALVIIGAIVIVLYIRLTKAGDIWWMDASRNALNGAFVLDFLRAMPLRHPAEFAFEYYRQWPALTILFYPPLFYAALAASYALFGVSEAAALVPEMVAMFLLGWGVYRLSRNWLDGPPALATSLLIIGAPEVSFWGQQVMLDVPAYAFLAWAAAFQLRYLKGGPSWALSVAGLCAVGAIYTKYNAAFFVGVMLLALLHQKGLRCVTRRPVITAAGLGAVLLVPLLVLFVKFSSYNLAQATAVDDAVAARWSFAGLTYYARIMPEVLSWPTTLLAVAYTVVAPFVPRLRLPREDAVYLLLWLGLGYVFYTMIAVKEPRHILFITYPLVLAAVLLLDRLASGRAWRAAVTPVLAVCVLVGSAAMRPPPYVTGMRAAAQEIARIAPPDSNVAFWGRLDGTFIFAMRAYAARPDLGVVRLDKVLLGDLAISLERGFTEKELSPEQIIDQLRELHVQYVVAQTGYADQIGVIRKLDAALHSDKFREIGRIRMTANYVHPYITELVLYRAVADVPPGRVSPPIDIKVINRSF